MLKVLGALVSVFGRKKGDGPTAQTVFEVADAAFVRKCQEVHGYTPVRLKDGYAHPVWLASRERERAQHRSHR